MLSKIFTTEGRLNRLSYLKYVVVFSILSFLLTRILGLVIGNPESMITYIATLPFSIATIMAAIRRLHDLNRSGWFMLITLIPVVNFLFGIYILCFRGTEGSNQYGEDPLAL